MSRAMRPSLFRLMGRSFIDSESGSRPASPRLFGQHSREPANFAGFDNFKFPTINFIERAFCRSARGTEFEPVFLIALLKQRKPARTTSLAFRKSPPSTRSRMNFRCFSERFTF